MKKIILPLFIFVGTFCFGQDYLPVFADKDSVRYQIRHTWTGSFATDYSIWTDKETIDSLVYDSDSTEYRVLKFINRNKEFDTLLVREDTIEKKIYAKSFDDDMEYPIYNFSLPVDSIDVVYGYLSKDEIGIGIICVKDEWVENYAGMDRKVQLVELSSFDFHDKHEIEIIEGLGTKKGFSRFFDYFYVTHLPREELACLFHDGELVYTIGDCYLDTMFSISNTEEVELKEKILIYPNPVIDELTIRSEKPFKKETRFELFDLNGTLVRKEILVQNRSQLIDLENIVSGLYFYQIKENSKLIQSDKLIFLK